MRDQQPDDELFTQRLRLNKFLAERGICSRRDADLWIESGRVTVNDEYVDVGAYVDDNDQVRVDGELIAAYKMPKRVYIALNKPVDVECTTDTSVDGNIIDFVGHHERIFPIGRLDKDSDGLILLTNDGEIVNKILRSEQNHDKEYLVTVDHKISAEFLRGMAAGVRILRRTTKPCRTYKVAANTFGIVLTEGMNRQIRKMAEAFNYRVLKLTRVRIMNISLGHLKLGRWRNLTPVELAQLRTGIQTAAPALAPVRKPRVISKRPTRVTATTAPAKTRQPRPAAIWDQARVARSGSQTADGEARRASGLGRRPTTKPSAARSGERFAVETDARRPGSTVRRPPPKPGAARSGARFAAEGEAKRPSGLSRRPMAKSDALRSGERFAADGENRRPSGPSRRPTAKPGAARSGERLASEGESRRPSGASRRPAAKSSAARSNELPRSALTKKPVSKSAAPRRAATKSAPARKNPAGKRPSRSKF